MDLAAKVIEAIEENDALFTPLYQWDQDVMTKIDTIAEKISWGRKSRIFAQSTKILKPFLTWNWIICRYVLRKHKNPCQMTHSAGSTIRVYSECKRDTDRCRSRIFDPYHGRDDAYAGTTCTSCIRKYKY